jgi:hypothetical protein
MKCAARYYAYKKAWKKDVAGDLTTAADKAK